MSEFRLKPGTSVVVTPTKSRYTEAENVIMKVSCTIEARGLTPPFGAWISRVRVFDSRDDQIGTDKQIHSYTGTEDTVSFTANVNCGKFSAGILSGYATAEG